MGEYLGYAAGVLTTFCYVPQLVRVFKLRSAREISYLYTFSLLLGTLIWLLYGIFQHLVPIILWNVITFSLVSTLLLAKTIYGRR